MDEYELFERKLAIAVYRSPCASHPPAEHIADWYKLLNYWYNNIFGMITSHMRHAFVPLHGKHSGKGHLNTDYIYKFNYVQFDKIYTI